MAVSVPEVIDLTGSPPDDSDEVQIVSGPSGPSGSSSRSLQKQLALARRLFNNNNTKPPSSSNPPTQKPKQEPNESNAVPNSTKLPHSEANTNGNSNGKKRRKRKKKVTPSSSNTITNTNTPQEIDFEEGEIEEVEDSPISVNTDSTPGSDLAAVITSAGLENAEFLRARNKRTPSGGNSKSESSAMRNGRSLLDRLEKPESTAPQKQVPATNGSKDGGTTSTSTSGAAQPTPSTSKSSKKRKRSKDQAADGDAKTPSKHRRSLTPPIRPTSPSGSVLFVIDDKPAEIPSSMKPPPPPFASLDTNKTMVKAEKEKEKEGPVPLLLPAHVSVVGEFGESGAIPVEIIPSDGEDSEGDSGIEYLDYDDDRKRPGLVRYFDDPVKAAAENAPAKFKKVVCKNCGAEGDHKTFECRVLICLTCGAREEHSTRSCPISKICFTCGMKGHTRNTCPIGYSNGISRYDNCDRCGSDRHSTKECPTLWRMYEYVHEEERQEILRLREEKSDLRIGEGGEGYIAMDDWCYNCGGCGHLGDDCTELPRPADFPSEPSAFSAYNTRSGPFYDPTRADQPSASSSSRKSRKAKVSRDWIREDGTWADGYGFAAPVEVGKQGRRKERARMEQKAREQDLLDEEEDWFARRGAGSSRSGGGGGGGTNGRGKGPPSSGKDRNKDRNGKKITISDLGRDRDRFSGSGSGARYEVDFPRSSNRDGRGRYADLPTPARETDPLQIRGAASKSQRDRDRDRDRDRRNGGGGRSYDRELDYGSSGRNSSRYKGGYAR